MWFNLPVYLTLLTNTAIIKTIIVGLVELPDIIKEAKAFFY